MSDFASAVERLVQVALKSGKDKELGPAVQGVMSAFDEEDTKAIRAAMRSFDKGLASAKGRGAQVLHLALGALVEAGAPPELAWPPIERGLKETLEAAARFAHACVTLSAELDVEDAVRRAGARITKKMPREAAAWALVRSRSLAGVACLSRSAKLRAKTRTSDLAAATSKLEDAIEEVGFLSQVMRVLDDETMLVVHPKSRRGFRVDVHEVSTNLELYVLLLDAIVGDAKKGFLEGSRPNPRAVAVLKNPEADPKTAPEVKIPWQGMGWRSLAEDGALPAADESNGEDGIRLEGVPSEIEPFEGERVVLLQSSVTKTEKVETSYAALSPRVTLKAKLPRAEVDALLVKMGEAAAKARAQRAPAKRSTKAAASVKSTKSPVKARKSKR